jgi:lysophospholipase L1-like esterase
MDPYHAERGDPYCLDAPAGATLLGRAAWQRLLVMGDSIAAGIGDAVEGYRDRSWPDRLADALSPSAYLNLGQAGARTTEVRANQLGRALAFGPDVAVVAAGANDALPRSFDPVDVESELDRIVAALNSVGALVVTFGCFDLGRTSFGSPDRRAGVSERLHALGRLTAAVSRRYGGVHVDFLRHPALSDSLMSADRIHINRRGHAIVAADVIRALAEQVGRADR